MGVRVFVVRVVPTHVIPAAAAATGPVRRFVASLPSYELVGRVSGEGTGVKLLYAFNDEIATGFAAPRHRVFALVPTAVARVVWRWPRLFDSATLGYSQAVSRSAVVHDNIAVTASPYDRPPSIATWYGSDLRVLRRNGNPNAASGQYGPGRSRPSVPTTVTRRAEHDPSTPNRVVVVRAQSGAPSTFLVLFHVLIHGAEYGAHVSGPHPGCVHLPHTHATASLAAHLSPGVARSEVYYR